MPNPQATVEGPSVAGSLTLDVRIYEYTQAADPISSGATPPIPYTDFPASLHQSGPSKVIPLDLSAKLKRPGPLTSPGLCANFIRLLPGETIETRPNASSELYYVLRGRGTTHFAGQAIPWSQGDILTLPSGDGATHEAEEDAAFYWVHDEPLLRYLGARAAEPTFNPTLFRAEETLAELAKAAADPDAANRSRISVLLANRTCDQTLTITPTLWAMLGILPIGAVQLPHRHQSVALDLIIDCQPGCYTLVGKDLDANGRIIDPIRVDWKPASVFVTPPGEWHAHFNESGVEAYLLPIQDAGLQTYLRSLDIRFYSEDREPENPVAKDEPKAVMPQQRYFDWRKFDPAIHATEGSPFAEEETTYAAHLDELLAHEGQYVLIKGRKILGIFPTQQEGMEESVKHYDERPVMVKRIEVLEPMITLANVRN
jgi:gentisate 1,2-dioxygenase